MYCQAYVKDDRLFVNFDGTSVVYDKLSFELGDAATDFAALPETVYGFVFEKFKDAFLALYYNLATYDDTLITLKNLAVATSSVNTYFNFYIDNFIMYLMRLHGHEQRNLIPVLAVNFLIDGGKDAGLKGVDILNPKIAANSGFEVFMNDLKKRQTRLKEDFDAIASNSDEFAKFIPDSVMGR